MGRQGVGLGRKAKGKSLGKHKAIDRWLDTGRASERGASSREPGFIDGKSRVKAVARGEAKRISDMGFGIQVGGGRARASGIVGIRVKLTLPGSITANSSKPRAAKASIWAKRDTISFDDAFASANG